MNVLKLKAYGKVNLALDVVGRRQDGYHELRTVMQTVAMYDSIFMKRSWKPGIQFLVNVPFVPADAGNLAYRAAELLMEEFGIADGVEISLHKYLPVAAGMAGGSSDAATVLYGMNRLFRLGLSVDELAERGVKLGADVPYCIHRGTMLAEGIGERLTRLPAVPPCTVLVAKPMFSVSTKAVYEKLDSSERLEHPDVDAMVRAIRAGDLVGMTEHMGNVLETVTEPAYPAITELKRVMRQGGALGAMMSGSGPTVFGIFADRERAEAVRGQILQRRLTRMVYVTEFYHPRVIQR